MSAPKAPTGQDVARALLLFYDGLEWTDLRREQWLALTGRKEATTRTLCDFARDYLANTLHEDTDAQARAILKSIIAGQTEGAAALKQVRRYAAAALVLAGIGLGLALLAALMLLFR